ncbi:MAG: WG repeat-containing protein [Bacteroides sp.]|nr:WG repeat-containing protein [Bacteroides sp.]
MKAGYIFYALLVVFIVSSCHGARLSTKNFVAINDLAELNGKYINKENYLSNVFNITNREIDMDVINLEFSGKDSLIISYIDTIGYKKLALKGKRKENFFQVYFQNLRFYLFPVFVMNQIDRIRIGKDKDGNLLIYKWDEHYGMIFPMAGGTTDDEYQVSFGRYDKNVEEGLYAVKINDKWGYADKEDQIVISPVYEYAHPFKNGLAKVGRNKRWGYIDSLQNEVIPVIYEVIMKPEDDVMRVRKDGKWGIIDFQNNELAAPQYDLIKAFYSNHNDSLKVSLAEVHRNGKIGYVNKQGRKVIPVEYDEIEWGWYGIGTGHYRSKSGDKYGFVSRNGVLCKPIFDKAGRELGYNGFSPKNRDLVKEIGTYTEVIYKGERYLFTEKGKLYKYKKLGFFKENRLVVELDSGFYPE